MSMAMVRGQDAACSAPAGSRGEGQIDFIDTAARIAGAVSIVAGQDKAGPFGLVVSSLTVLSVEPARVLFCIRKAAACYARLREAEALSLTVLGHHDEDAAAAFTARDRPTPRFTSDRWVLDATRPPRFEGGLVSMEGEVFQRISAASHTIFILNVEQSRHEDAEPLLYFNRSYRRLALNGQRPRG
jgi:flavin reductase (DIM6/NTAB) family NADH-FMN oxidoreductase RutF